MNRPSADNTVEAVKTEGVTTLLGNPKKAIIKLSIPMIIAMSVQTIYNFIDALWVSGLGADALSSVGFFFPFFFMIMALAIGLGVGGSSAVSRRIGAQDKAGADQVATHTIVLMFIISTIVSVPFIVLIKPILIRMGAGNVVDTAASYARIMFAGTIVIFFSNNASALLRGEGDVKRAMYAMMLGAGLNIVLDPVFIYTLRLGVPGAAIATLISLCISGSILFYWICVKRNTYVTIRIRKFRFKASIVRDILKVGLPSSIQHLAMAASLFFINLIVVKVGGTDGVAVYTTGWRVAMFATLPILGMATAVTSVSGAAYGARDFKKLSTAHAFAVKIGFFIELVIAAATYLLAVQITGLFTMAEESARIAPDLILFFRILFVFYPTISLGMLSSSLFQGTGKGLYALIVTVVRTIVMVVPAIYILAIVLGHGLVGVWWGIVIGNTTGALLAFVWARLFIRQLQAGLFSRHGAASTVYVPKK
jgi:putative MATE family efflux protein